MANRFRFIAEETEVAFNRRPFGQIISGQDLTVSNQLEKNMNSWRHHNIPYTRDKDRLYSSKTDGLIDSLD